ncbi:MAG: tetratricopeptide repeat protein [Halioglobus sp.]
MAKQPITLENAMALAKQSAEKGDVAAARNLYKKVLESDPGYKPAREALKKLRNRKNPAQVPAENFQLDMAALMALHTNGSLDDALKEAVRLSRKYPAQPMPLNLQGSILFTKQRYAEAVAVLTQAHELAPEYDSAILNLGQALAKLDHPKNAMEMFDKALEMNPNSATALTQKGGLLLESRQTKEAQACLEKALEINPYDANTQHYYGKLLSITGSRNAALAHLRNALDIEPTDVNARLTLASTLSEMKLFTAAVDELTMAADIEPGDSAIHYRLAMALLNKDDTDKAISCLERSIELNPTNGHARHFLAIAKGETTPTAPPDYVKDVFDDYAKTFESSLLTGLEYDGPNILRQMIDELEGVVSTTLLDIGCGTGLAGTVFHDLASEMTGIDLSPRMLETAKEKGLYANLVNENAVSWLSNQTQIFDLFLATDVLIYVGNLEPLFQAVRSRSHSSSRFAVTTENLHEQGDGDIKLLRTGRYAHSEAYVIRAAQACGFTIEARKHAPLRKEKGQWLEGGYYILRAVA